MILFLKLMTLESFHCTRLAFTQVGEMYVFTVADSSRVDSFEIVVEEEGHNALEDLDGPMKVIFKPFVIYRR